MWNKNIWIIWVFLAAGDWARDLLLRSWNRETFSSVNCLFFFFTDSSYCIVIYLCASVLFCSVPFFLVSLVTHLFLFIFSLKDWHWPTFFFTLSLLVSYASRYYWYFLLNRVKSCFCFSQMNLWVLVCDTLSIGSEIRSKILCCPHLFCTSVR